MRELKVKPDSNRSRRTFFWILPMTLRGSSSTRWIYVGTL
jgi:hypothetical protein